MLKKIGKWNWCLPNFSKNYMSKMWLKSGQKNISLTWVNWWSFLRQLSNDVWEFPRVRKPILGRNAYHWSRLCPIPARFSRKSKKLELSGPLHSDTSIPSKCQLGHPQWSVSKCYWYHPEWKSIFSSYQIRPRWHFAHF